MAFVRRSGVWFGFAIGLADSYESFLLFRLAIGCIGAAFVITQYHTSVMFAPNVVGTANATTAGWGNLGGGVTQIVMPLVFAGILVLGFTAGDAWRLAMVIPGIVLFLLLPHLTVLRNLTLAPMRTRGLGRKEAAELGWATRAYPLAELEAKVTGSTTRPPISSVFLLRSPGQEI